MKFILGAALFLFSSRTALSSPVTAPGFLRAEHAQFIRPNAADWSFKIVELVPEGTEVKKGDLIARFEGENLLKRKKEMELSAMRDSVAYRDQIAALQGEIYDLQEKLAALQKELELLKAANTGKGFPDYLPAREKLQNQLDMQSKELTVKQQKEKIERKKILLVSVQKQAEQSDALAKTRLEGFENDEKGLTVYADRDGTVSYLLNYNREKPKKGQMTYRLDVAEITDSSELYVEAFPRERQFGDFAVGDKVTVKVLGAREVEVAGKIVQKDDIIMKAKDWDRTLPETHYIFNAKTYRLRVTLDSIPQEARPNGEVEIIKGD